MKHNSKKEKVISYITEEIRSLELAPKINGCPMTQEWAEQLEIMRTCLNAVQDHFPDSTKMVPLTMEQLRGMDGRPVWVEDLENPEKSGWRLIYWYRGKYLVLLAKSASGYILEDYGETWLAYAYQPAHIDREAWEPCGNCKPSCGNCISGDEYEDDCPLECQCCVNHNNYRPKDKYCSACGLPLTEGAWAELEKRLRGFM